MILRLWNPDILDISIYEALILKQDRDNDNGSSTSILLTVLA